MLLTVVFLYFAEYSNMNSKDNRLLKDKTKNLLTNARWVVKVTLDTSPFLFIGLIVCKSINSAFPAALAWVGRGLINSIVDASREGINNLDPVVSWILLSLVLVLASEVISVITRFIQRRLNEEVRLKIDLAKLSHAANLDVSWFEDPNFQDVAERSKQNTSAHFTGFLQKVVDLTTNVLKVVGLVLVLLAIDPMVVLIMLPIVFPYVLFKWSQSKARFNKAYTRATKWRWSNYFASILSNRGSVAEVKLLKLAPLLIEKYHSLAKEFIKEDRRIYTRGFIGNFLFSVVFAVIFYVLFGRIAKGVLAGRLTIGDVAMFAGATGHLRVLLNSFATQVSGAVEDMLYIDNLAELFKIEPLIKSTSGKSFSSGYGEIEIRNVYFTYPGSKRTILSNISLHIRPGETIALVGKNGAGKTTLAKLIARLYDPDEGSILFDGMDLRELSLEYYHSQISFVFPIINRYEATVAENIAYGDWQHLKHTEKVKEIAHLADVHDMIMEMPEAYDTILGRRFGEYDLSGGQWRKIAISRAVARKSSSILILDEPTSNLDAQAKYALFSRFRELAADRTTILISHHFSTIGLAQRIYVMDKGRIIETGTHSGLIAQNGHYANLYRFHQRHEPLGVNKRSNPK